MHGPTKWFTPTTPDGQNSIKQHAFRGGRFLRVYTGESYEGNRALCTSNIKLTESGPRVLKIDEIEDEGVEKEHACKKCMKMAGIDHET